mmetsp:Transcript_12331/g.19130  ORF Transcript_12331/g.19130 Transcript_12331/m.19130 type:complete len:109 (-) Transcript_12331:144-470(-)
MMRKVFGQVGVPLPSNYLDKLKQLQRNTAVGGLKRGNSNKSLFSMVSRTNISSSRNKSILDDEDEDDKDDLHEVDSNFTDDDAEKSTPMIAGMVKFFQDLSGEISTYS